MLPDDRHSPPPRITVIIAVRNGAATLQRALDSVFEQTYADTELIVMDGASTDATPAIVERNAARIGYWVSEPDTGIYDAWNKALGHVTGDWICFLGADDRLHAPDVLERVAAALVADGGEHRVRVRRPRPVPDQRRRLRTPLSAVGRRPAPTLPQGRDDPAPRDLPPPITVRRLRPVRRPVRHRRRLRIPAARAAGPRSAAHPGGDHRHGRGWRVGAPGDAVRADARGVPRPLHARDRRRRRRGGRRSSTGGSAGSG